MLQFKRNDLTLNPEDPELPYRRRKDEEKKSIAYGQRKLMLTLVQFITNFWDPEVVPNPKLVYAGAAPGTNIGIVSTMFPEIEFHLYDPRPFKIKLSDKIKTYQQYFTNEDAQKWADRDDIFFVSDIRTADYNKASDLDENEQQIMDDMQMQMEWYNIIKPVRGHLKFRLPYTGGNRPSHMEYLYGYVFKQCWAPQTSTETRLVPVYGNDGEPITKLWNCQKYQDQMFYHNVIVRESFCYDNPFVQSDDNNNNETQYIDYPELLNDWDSRAETQILMDYIYKRVGKVGKHIQQMVIALSRMITTRLNEKSRYKDTLASLRANPQFIKKRNMKQTRDNMKEEIFHSKHHDAGHDHKLHTDLLKELGL